MATALIIAWGALGFIALGWQHAWFRRRFADSLARNEDELRGSLAFMVVWCLVCGPLAILMVGIHTNCGQYGWTLSTQPGD